MYENKEMKLSFQVSSRLPILLGDELIPDAGYAVFELVKNSHDADATVALVDLIDVHDKKIGRITVEDDGHGMNLEDIKESWMVVGATRRRNQTKSGEITPKFKRPFLGEKGIGRFAAHKLGSRIKLITRKKDSPEYVVKVNWDNFDPEEPTLIEKVPADIIEKTPEKFTENSTGTSIEITGLRENWVRGQVRDLHRDITSICSPFDVPESFRAVLSVTPQKEWLGSLFSFEDVERYALFSAECTIEGKSFEYMYSMKGFDALKDRVEGRDFKFNLSFPEKQKVSDDTSKELPIDRFSLQELDLMDRMGRFKLRLLMFDLTPEILRIVVPEDRTGLKRFLKENGGIRVYRGGIRVFGLGGVGEDWLNLGGRRVQLPQRRLSNNQVIGAVVLSPEAGDFLKEQTNRRGFTENFAFRTFRKALLYVISQIESERFKDKERIKAVLSGIKVKAPVLNELALLRREIRKLGTDEADQLEPALIRVEKAYQETRDMLEHAASSGMALAGVIHEAEKQVKGLLSAVRQDPLPVEQIREMVRQLSLTMEGITYILRKSPVTEESMKKLVEHVLFNAEHRFRHHGITVINGFNKFPDFKILCSRALLGPAILNIIDNAIWWLDNKGHKDKKVYVGPSREFGYGPALVIADNGPGFIDAHEDIIRPFFSRKPEGMGLGLYLVNEAMEKQNGRLKFPDPGDVELPPDIRGAVVALIFSEDKQ